MEREAEQETETVSQLCIVKQESELEVGQAWKLFRPIPSDVLPAQCYTSERTVTSPNSTTHRRQETKCSNMCTYLGHFSFKSPNTYKTNPNKLHSVHRCLLYFEGGGGHKNPALTCPWKLAQTFDASVVLSLRPL